MNQSDKTPTTNGCVENHAWLEFTPRSTNADIVIAAHAIDGETCRGLGATPAYDPSPLLPRSGARIERIVAHDVIEHVIDEASWLKCMAGLLEPGGELILRVPLEGPVAWLDALNLMRYAQDITDWARQPNEPEMKMWHRHYRLSDLERLLTEAGFTVVDVERSGSPHLELVQLAARILGKISGQCRAPERHEIANRVSSGAARLGPRLGPLSTKLAIRAVKTADGSY